MHAEGEQELGPLARSLGFGLSPRRAAWLALWMLLAAAVPLLLLADWGAVEVPLLGDYAVLARVLIALPLLVLGGSQFDRLVNDALSQAVRTGLVPAEARQAHDLAADRLRRLRVSRVAGFLFAATAVALALVRPSVPGALAGLSGWGFSAAGDLNAAGIWYGFVVLPLFRFLALLWIWRLLLWTLYLARLAFFRLSLDPAHPDRAGGLGYLGFVQQRLSLLLTAGSFMLAGSAANRIAYLDQSVATLFNPLIVYGVGYPLLLIAPLLLTTPMLMEAKRRAVLDYGALGQAIARDFEHSWVAPNGTAERLLESPHASALCDFGSVHETVVNMNVIPIRTFGLGVMVASAVVPLLLLVFLQVSLESLLKSALAEVPPFDLMSTAEPK
jgi:hypothetical protein